MKFHLQIIIFFYNIYLLKLKKQLNFLLKLINLFIINKMYKF